MFLSYEVTKMLNKYNPFFSVIWKKKDKVQKITKDFKKVNPNVYGIRVDLSKPDGEKNV